MSQQTRRLGADVPAALLHTTTHVAIGNLTAAATLALAFFAAIFADFKAVAELGWIAGCGVVLCAFAYSGAPRPADDLRPASPVNILAQWKPWRPSLGYRIASLEGRGWLPGLMHHPGWVCAAAAVLIVALGWGTTPRLLRS